MKFMPILKGERVEGFFIGGGGGGGICSALLSSHRDRSKGGGGVQAVWTLPFGEDFISNTNCPE